MSAKRGFWSVVGKILWTIITFVFKIAGKLGSRWARKKVDERKARKGGRRAGRVLHAHSKR